jgi:hypothetical protein
MAHAPVSCTRLLFCLASVIVTGVVSASTAPAIYSAAVNSSNNRITIEWSQSQPFRPCAHGGLRYDNASSTVVHEQQRYGEIACRFPCRVLSPYRNE